MRVCVGKQNKPFVVVVRVEADSFGHRVSARQQVVDDGCGLMPVVIEAGACTKWPF